MNPEVARSPKGWSNGLSRRPAGGCSSWPARRDGRATDVGEPPAFAAQFARALDKVLAVVADAGGAPTDIARMTIYVTDSRRTATGLKPIGELWRARLGRHYPAMALVEVKGLVDRGAVVEIEATAVRRSSLT